MRDLLIQVCSFIVCDPKIPSYEMIGYQADLGDKYWASLYDESRRNKTLTGPDSATVC
jgi:hypothetical protein